MHERWTPDQIAAAITNAEENFGKPFVAFIVMELAKMEQKTVTTPGTKAEDEANELGTCDLCHNNPAIAVVGHVRCCYRCYERMKPTKLTDAPEEGQDAESQ